MFEMYKKKLIILLIFFSLWQPAVIVHALRYSETLHREKKFFACMEKTFLETTTASASAKPVKGNKSMLS